jgi:segregation and condensation protein B
VPGRPTLWATTPTFLTQFGLRDISELPKRSELVLENGVPSGDGAQALPEEADLAQADNTDSVP